MKRFKFNFSIILFFTWAGLAAQVIPDGSALQATQWQHLSPGRTPLENLKVIYDGMPFEELEARAENYFAKAGKAKGSGWKQYMRWQTMRSFECDENNRLWTGESWRQWREA